MRLMIEVREWWAGLRALVSVLVLVFVVWIAFTRMVLEYRHPHEWRVVNLESLGHEWAYVDVVTGRSDDAEVMNGFSAGTYCVFSRGAAYGDFLTLDQAKAQAERICKELGFCK